MKLLICRTIIIYLCVLFAMRLMGKRQLGELQPEELVSTILISNLASISIESEEVPITSSLIPLFLIAALELLGSVLSFRSQKFFNFLSGRPKTSPLCWTVRCWRTICDGAAKTANGWSGLHRPTPCCPRRSCC